MSTQPPDIPKQWRLLSYLYRNGGYLPKGSELGDPKTLRNAVKQVSEGRVEKLQSISETRMLSAGQWKRSETPGCVTIACPACGWVSLIPGGALSKYQCMDSCGFVGGVVLSGPAEGGL